MLKKVLPWLVAGVLLVVAIAVIVGGAVERNKVVTRGVTIDAAGYVGKVWAQAIDSFTAKTGINVNVIGFSTSDGTTIAIDAMLKSGIIPNTLSDFTGRASKYMVQTSKLKAMDFKPYMTQEQVAAFRDLTPWTRDGKILGLPQPSPGQAMLVNVTLLKKYGIPIPDDTWTIDDFYAAAHTLKENKAYATVLFAANPSADYLYINWFAAFGARIFNPGDYSKTAVRSSGGLATFQFFYDLVKLGYAPKEAPELWDDAALEIWMKGNVAFMPLRPDWVPSYKATAKDQKFNTDWFEWKFLPFPAAVGVKAVPTVGTGNTLVAFEKGDKAKDKATAMWCIYATGVETNDLFTRVGAFPALKIDTAPPDPSLVAFDDWSVVKGISEKAGWMDVGYTLPVYMQIREELPKELQAMWKGQKSPEKALADYADFIDGVLK